MSANFLKLPSELRNRIYELWLFHEKPLDPWIDYNQRHELAPCVLCANKTVHHEASPLFYGQNRFNFTWVSAKAVALSLI
jgi:hypothetical protein